MPSGYRTCCWDAPKTDQIPAVIPLCIRYLHTCLRSLGYPWQHLALEKLSWPCMFSSCKGWAVYICTWGTTHSLQTQPSGPSTVNPPSARGDAHDSHTSASTRLFFPLASGLNTNCLNGLSFVWIVCEGQSKNKNQPYVTPAPAERAQPLLLVRALWVV